MTRKRKLYLSIGIVLGLVISVGFYIGIQNYKDKSKQFTFIKTIKFPSDMKTSYFQQRPLPQPFGMCFELDASCHWYNSVHILFNESVPIEEALTKINDSLVSQNITRLSSNKLQGENGYYYQLEYSPPNDIEGCTYLLLEDQSPGNVVLRCSTTDFNHNSH